MVKVYAPASVGNVSVGFDVLGAAVSPVDGSLLGDCVTVEAAPVFSLKTEGSFVSKLPADPQQNIAFQSWKRFCETLGRPIPVTMTLEKNMPVGSGLGSSACSVVAGLVAMNEFCDNPLNPHQLLQLMGELEGQISGSVHYDNVAPCYLGGLQLMLGEQNIISQSVAAFDHWFWVMAYPGIHVSTAEARAILPQYYSKADIIRHGWLLSGFIHACHTQQPELAAAMMQDVVAEPYRTQLLPGFAAARAACLKAGALACGISGSGPTLFAICDNEQIAEMVKNRLAEQYLQNDEGFVHICRLDTAGARKLG